MLASDVKINEELKSSDILTHTDNEETPEFMLKWNYIKAIVKFLKI